MLVFARGVFFRIFLTFLKNFPLRNSLVKRSLAIRIDEYLSPFLRDIPLKLLLMWLQRVVIEIIQILPITCIMLGRSFRIFKISLRFYS